MLPRAGSPTPEKTWARSGRAQSLDCLATSCEGRLSQNELALVVDSPEGRRVGSVRVVAVALEEPDLNGRWKREEAAGGPALLAGAAGRPLPPEIDSESKDPAASAGWLENDGVALACVGPTNVGAGSRRFFREKSPICAGRRRCLD